MRLALPSVKCNYDFGYTLPCKDFDPHLELKEVVTEHMNMTKKTFTNQILFLLCRKCVPLVDPKSLSNLDNEHSAFINDVIKSVDAENEAPLVLIKDERGRVVRVMR